MPVSDTGAVADAPKGNWVDRFAPYPLRPFLRLARIDRPIGSWLLFMPCLWSALLAANAGAPLPVALWHALLFGIGAVAMRGAGCTYNDIVDRDIDAQVARTRSRPLPSGQLGVRAAAAFLVMQALTGLVVLLQFNGFAVITGMASLAIVAIYPFMKRITSWPQSVLGLAFSWGALMGWAAAFGRLDAPAFWLYAGSILWVIAYDTIYAHQDREDDAIVGVRSTARLFGEHTRSVIAAFYAGCVVLIGVAMASANVKPLAFVGLAAFAVHLGWQVWRMDIRNADLCLALFKSNRDAGLLLAAGLLLGAVV